MTRYFPGRVGPPPGNVLWVWPMPYGPVESRPTQRVPVRIGDAERDRAIASLGDHFAAGRLTAEEFDQRMDQALKARFNERFWMTSGGLPHTEQLRLVERFSRTDFDTLKYEVTIEDPGAYTRPWSSTATLRWVAGEEMPRHLCQDNRP